MREEGNSARVRMILPPRAAGTQRCEKRGGPRPAPGEKKRIIVLLFSGNKSIVYPGIGPATAESSSSTFKEERI